MKSVKLGRGRENYDRTDSLKHKHTKNILTRASHKDFENKEHTVDSAGSNVGPV